MDETTYENKTAILSNFWLNYRSKDEFRDFIACNDLGLPLAYLISNGIVETTDAAHNLIDQTFDSLLESLGFDDTGDTGFENLADLMSSAPKK